MTYTRRCLRRYDFGQGFDSPHLHQIKSTPCALVKENIVANHPTLGVDRANTITHCLGLEFTDGGVCCYDLTVNIRHGYPVGIDKRYLSDTGAAQSLGAESSDTANAKDCNF